MKLFGKHHILLVLGLYGFFLVLTGYEARNGSINKLQDDSATVLKSDFQIYASALSFPFLNKGQKENTNNSCRPITSISFLSAVFQNFIATEFKRYKAAAGCIPIHYRKSDLLFPFQYFW